MTHSLHGKERIHRPLIGCLATLLLAVACLLPFGASAEDNYAERTPGQEFLHKALRAYEDGQYRIAQREFLSAARWSDKLAQYNLGAMHYHGQGFERDWARAWAWFKISAERNYPLFVDVADHVWAALDDAERERARYIYEDELLLRYSDEVTVDRTIRFMRRDQRKATGSRLGWAGGFLEVIEPDGPVMIDPFRGTLEILSGTRYRGEEFYEKEFWDFERIMRLEAALFDAHTRGEVTLGDFEIIEDDADRGQDEQ